MRDLAGKRATGFYNWHRTRQHFHREEVARQIVEDVQAEQPDHIAVTGDLINVALEIEFIHARRWLETVGPPSKVSLVPGNHDAYVRSAAAFPRLHWQDYMTGNDDAMNGADFPYVRRFGSVAQTAPTTPAAKPASHHRLMRGRISKSKLASSHTRTGLPFFRAGENSQPCATSTATSPRSESGIPARRRTSST